MDYDSFCSPLFVLLRDLVNASNVDGPRGIVKDSVLYLIFIFRAIKNAEDAIDVDKTPVRIFSKEIVSLILYLFSHLWKLGSFTMQRLHLLADIGYSFVTLTNHNGLSSSDGPGQILLPSSLYKVSISNRSGDQYFRSY